MRLLLTYIVILIIAVFVGLLVVDDPGYVLFSFHHWTMEMPFWLCVLVVVVGAWLIYFLWRLIYDVFSHHGRLRSWHRFRGVHGAHSYTSEGMLAFIEGHWSRAEKLLMSGVKRSRVPLINYLAAARAAQANGLIKKRNDYLKKAHHCSPKKQLAIGLTKAELELEQHEYEQALITLKQIYKLSTNHRATLKLLKKAYLATGDWEHLLKILPALERHNIFNEDELTNIQLSTYEHQFSQAHLTIKKLKACWKDVPRHLQNNTGIIKIYTKQLLEKYADAEASDILMSAMKKNWDDELIKLYACAHSDNPEQHLKRAENFLKNHPNNANLLLSLGKMAIQNKAWEQAKIYLQQTIEINPIAEAYIQLGLCYQQLGDNTQAFNAYQQGASLMS